MSRLSPRTPSRYRRRTPRQRNTVPKAPIFKKKQAGSRRDGGRQAKARLLMPRSTPAGGGRRPAPRARAGTERGPPAGAPRLPSAPPRLPPAPRSRESRSRAPPLASRPGPRSASARCPRPEPRGEAPGPDWQRPQNPDRAPSPRAEPPSPGPSPPTPGRAPLGLPLPAPGARRPPPGPEGAESRSLGTARGRCRQRVN